MFATTWSGWLKGLRNHLKGMRNRRRSNRRGLGLANFGFFTLWLMPSSSKAQCCVLRVKGNEICPHPLANFGTSNMMTTLEAGYSNESN